MRLERPGLHARGLGGGPRSMRVAVCLASPLARLPRRVAAACCSLAVHNESMSPKKDARGSGASEKAHYVSYLKVCNVDNSTASPSVLLFFDTSRYLFNAGEGIQRHFIEHKARMNKISAVLATRVSTDTLAGLPGMMLTQVPPGSDYTAEDAVRSVVYGPTGLAGYCSAFRNYASSFVLDVNELGESAGDVLQDSFVRISNVPLLPRGAPPLAEPVAADTQQTADLQGTVAEPATKRPRTEERHTVEGGGVAALPEASHTAVQCYICQLASAPGKFDPQKAAQLGVPRGPMYGQLQRGQSVTLANGQVVNPSDVMATPSAPGAIVVLLDCPSEAHLTAAAQAPELLALQAAAAREDEVEHNHLNSSSSGGSRTGLNTTAATGGADGAPTRRRVVLLHLGPSNVTRSNLYQAWTAAWGGGVDHLYVSADGQLVPTTAKASLLQAQLHAVEPAAFSLAGYRCLAEAREAAKQQQQQQSSPGGLSVHAGNGTRFTLAPLRNQGLSTDEVASPMDLDAAAAGALSSKPAVTTLLSAYQTQRAAKAQQPLPQQLNGIHRQVAELTLLGTCSATPSTYRNVSAYYLDLFDRGGLLFDCGEDTMGQLERRFGRQDAARRVSELHAVWVSHMHADHHGGLYPLLARRALMLQGATQTYDQQREQQLEQQQQQQQQEQSPPLLVLGPWPLFRVLCQYSRVLGFAFSFLPTSHFYAPGPRPPPPEALAAYEAVKAAAGLRALEPFAVQHVAFSTGLRIEGLGGWKIVMSGDTRPCDAVVEAARDATLLVHEATFEDDLADEAIAKKHSTTAEALRIAAAAGAYRTVLTHFSSRYPKIPVMRPSDADGAALADHGSVLVGFDLMSINLADLPWLPDMLPVLEEMFRDAEEEFGDDNDAGGGEAARTTT